MEEQLEEQLSEVLDNILGLLLLEGSYEIEEGEEADHVSIETKDAGRLIGARGESLEALQLIVNQIMGRKMRELTPSEVEGFKRVIFDVEGWRKQKEEELTQKALEWGKQVLETQKDLELEPQSPWQRRVIHMVIGEMKGLATESVSEGRDRHVVIKLKTRADKSEQKPVPSEVEGSKVKSEEN